MCVYSVYTEFLIFCYIARSSGLAHQQTVGAIHFAYFHYEIRDCKFIKWSVFAALGMRKSRLVDLFDLIFFAIFMGVIKVLCAILILYRK